MVVISSCLVLSHGLFGCRKTCGSCFVFPLEPHIRLGIGLRETHGQVVYFVGKLDTSLIRAQTLPLTRDMVVVLLVSARDSYESTLPISPQFYSGDFF